MKDPTIPCTDPGFGENNTQCKHSAVYLSEVWNKQAMNLVYRYTPHTGTSTQFQIRITPRLYTHVLLTLTHNANIVQCTLDRGVFVELADTSVTLRFGETESELASASGTLDRGVFVELADTSVTLRFGETESELASASGTLDRGVFVELADTSVTLRFGETESELASASGTLDKGVFVELADTSVTLRFGETESELASASGTLDRGVFVELADTSVTLRFGETESELASASGTSDRVVPDLHRPCGTWVCVPIFLILAHANH
ncbi:hypothetical protein M8J75_009910 [Diaphorina citri]|nr:hypothetical protein M8J75_009910 [Diaphorina citri]